MDVGKGREQERKLLDETTKDIIFTANQRNEKVLNSQWRSLAVININGLSRSQKIGLHAVWVLKLWEGRTRVVTNRSLKTFDLRLLT